MTKQEAMEIVRENRNWNTGQKSLSLAFGGRRTDEDDYFDKRRAALKKAWATLAEEEDAE